MHDSKHMRCCLFSGIYTGSVYTDPFKIPLPGSLNCPLNNEFIIKTHYGHDKIEKESCNGTIEHAFKKAIYILRNPYNTLIAEFNRRNAGQGGTANLAKFQSEGMYVLLLRFQFEA